MSGSVSLTLIAVCQVLTTLAAMAAAAALIYAVFAFKRLVDHKVEDALNRVQPIVDQARSVAEQARETAENVSEKVGSIVSRAESTVGLVGDRVDSLSAKVEEGMSPQLITVAGIVGTAVKCAQIYKDIITTKQGGDGADSLGES